MDGRLTLHNRAAIARSRYLRVPAMLLLIGSLPCAPAQAVTSLTKLLVAQGDQVNPVFLTAAPGDGSRVFIVDQRSSAGIPNRADIHILKIPANTLNAEPFLSIVPVTTHTEQGLLGMAFDPAYNENGFFYISYTTGCDDPPAFGGCGSAGQSVIARYTVSTKVPGFSNPSPDVADPASRVIIFQINQPQANHNGGCIQFGPDEMLYLGLGDGGGEGDPFGAYGNGQELTTYMGKMLRFDLHHPPTFVPADNPSLYGTPVDLKWQLGLRNPWRFSFDRANGDLFIGDVGQFSYEEIDYIPAGTGAARNLGWRCREGNAIYSCNAGPHCLCPSDPGLTAPLYAYSHSTGTCVIGGYVYRGARIPDLQGTYFFGDYGSGSIYSFLVSNGTYSNLIDRTSSLRANVISSFGEDAEGELYMCCLGAGVYKIIVDCSGSALSISPQPTDQTVCLGQNVAFTVGVSGTRGAFTYTWRRGGVSIGAPSSPTLSLNDVQRRDAGSYDVVIQDQCNTSTSNAAVLTVNTPGPGDENSDCVIDEFDLAIFVDVLLDIDTDPVHQARADMNSDTFWDGLDIAIFTRALAP